MSGRALIVKLGAIGDVVMSLPSVRLLHESGLKIDWVCGRSVYPLLQCYSWIQAMPVDDRAILSGGAIARSQSIFDLWMSVAKRRYDLCATLYYDRRYKVLSFPVRAKKKVMLSRNAREYVFIPGRSQADEYARILLSSEDTCRANSLSPVRPDRLTGEMPLPEVKGKRVAIVPAGASNMLRQQTLRRWPVENYVALAKQLLERGWQVVLLGGPDDLWVRPYFKELAVTDCLGILTLPQVILTCDSCDVVISHDTGPLHLAGLSYAAVVGLFGPTDPGNFLPRREFVTGIWGGVNFACRPCYDGIAFAPCRQNACMSQITPALVLREIDNLLERKALCLPSPPRIAMPEGVQPLTNILGLGHS